MSDALGSKTPGKERQILCHPTRILEQDNFTERPQKLCPIMITRLLQDAYVAGYVPLQSWLRVGTDVFDYEWDMLVILDACRTDALREVKHEYDFIETVDEKWSIGSTSKEWLENTFVEKNRKAVENTAYVSANSFGRFFEEGDIDQLDYLAANGSKIVNNRLAPKLIRDDVLSAEDFLEFDLLWKEDLIGTDDSSIHPEVVTDKAISTMRSLEPDRLIVHYMQPHQPYIYTDEMEEWHTNPFQYLKNGGDFETVWDAYVENLRFILDHLEVLLTNADADSVLVTADHGELFGEWGLHAHALGIPHPKLRKVPWVWTEATDENTHTPDSYESRTLSSDQSKSRLKDLGYL